MPIFVGAVQDGSIFLNIVKLKRLLGDEFKLEIDVNDDVFEMGAMQHHCFGTLKKQMAVWILGGGVPKNYTLQGEPLLDQILGVPTHGFDFDVQFCVDPVDNGALSSCPAGEGHTWGKVSAESVQYGSMYVHCDVTAVFPWLTYALLSDPTVHRKPRRLYDARKAAVAKLQRGGRAALQVARADDGVPAAEAPEEREEERREEDRQEEVTRVELHEYSVDDCLRAIHARNGDVRALLRVLDEPQRADRVKEHAPLAGVPYVLKDTWDTRGIITTGGSWRHRERVPRESGSIHRALEDAGAVLLGKSNLPDLALSNESDNHLVGATCNPFDPTRTAGGSTGGGAAAIATGMAAFDWGGDFGGSIRTPAASCGIAGIRLSSAAWPASNEQFPLLAEFFQPLLGMGPLAKTVDGCRRVMRAAAPSMRASYGAPTIAKDDVVLYSPDDATLGEWPTFTGDIATRLMSAGVRFEVDRTLPGRRA